MAENDDRKKQLKWTLIAYGIILAIFIILSFPIVNINGKWILLVSPMRPASIKQYDGWVLGNHTLETEHGAIRLGHGSQIFIKRLAVGDAASIEVESFRKGRASHSLVVYGIEMPPNISIVLEFNPIKILTLALDRQEIIVSGIPIRVGNFTFMPYRIPSFGIDADILIEGGGGHIPGTIITLADSAQILTGERSSRS